MRHEEKLLFISSCLISFSLFFLLGEKTMNLNSDAVAKRFCCKRFCCKAMLLNNGAIR